MSKELTKQVTDCVLATSATMNDNDQRSAIGMADSWARNGRLDLWNPAQNSTAGQDKPHGQIHCPARDALAAAIVALIEGAPQKDARAALKAVRETINRPYINASMVGFQAARAKAGAVGSEKKNEKAGLS